MTTEEIGAYVLLLNHQAQYGPLPSSIRRLAAIARMPPGAFQEIWDEVLRDKFDQVQEGWENARMAKERAKSVKRSRQAKEAADARWKRPHMQEHVQPHVHPEKQPTTHNPLPINQTPIPTDTRVRVRGDCPVEKLTVGGGVLPWVLDLLREFQAHADDPDTQARRFPNAGSAQKAAQQIMEAGEGLARAALDDCIASDGKTLSGYLAKAAEQRVRAENVQGGHKGAEEKRRDRINQNMSEYMAQAMKRDQERKDR